LVSWMHDAATYSSAAIKSVADGFQPIGTKGETSPRMLDFGPPTHFTYDLSFSSKATFVVMIQTGGPVPGVLQGTADYLSR
jgi:hypothetical protein